MERWGNGTLGGRNARVGTERSQTAASELRWKERQRSRVGVGRREDGVLEADELEHGEAELLEVARLERHDGRRRLHAGRRARARRRGRARRSRRDARRRCAARVRRRARARAVRRLVRRRRGRRRRGRGRGARRLLVRGRGGLRRHRRDGGRRAATEVPRAVDLARVCAAREEGEEARGEVDRAVRALHALAERAGAVSVAMQWPQVSHEERTSSVIMAPVDLPW